MFSGSFLKYKLMLEKKDKEEESLDVELIPKCLSFSFFWGILSSFGLCLFVCLHVVQIFFQRGTLYCHDLKQNEAKPKPVNNQQTKGVNWHSINVTRTQQEWRESPTVTLTWQASKYKVQKFHKRYIEKNSYLEANKYKVHKRHRKYILKTLNAVYINSTRGDPYLRMYFWCRSCTLCLPTYQMRVAVGDSGFCWCVGVTAFER